MNWIGELCDLYDKNIGIVGEVGGKIIKTKKGEETIPLILLPIFHTTVTAQITVTIDEQGDFLSAEPIDDKDKLTIIPVTDKSLARTVNPQPHPLCDSLKYLSGDYMQYYRSKKDKDFSSYYLDYMGELRRWHESEFTHEKVDAIYFYLEKGTLIHDLIQHGVLYLDEEGRVSDKEKIQNISKMDSFVRFRIRKIWNDGEEILSDQTGKFMPECWLDKTLQQSFIEYCKSMPGNRDLCYLSGEITNISYLQPKKIRHEGDGSKLISANDGTNYTFRGRFKDKNEAFAIGYEVSQKAHHALKWIIRKQGYRWDELNVVIWESDLKKLPDIYADTDSVCDDYYEESWDDEEDNQEDNQKPELYAGTDERGAQRFAAAMQGYGNKLKPGSETILISLNAATTGRLAMTEFKTFCSARYLENIRYWHEICEWLHAKFKDKKYYTYIGMAGVREIAEILYGTERNGALSLDGKAQMAAQLVQRLLPCISERAKIPEDLVNSAYRKASSPTSYENRTNWERVVSLACSLIKKQRWEYKKEVWNVALNQECSDRNYLYGRLLAIADRIEYRTYEKDEERMTNAKRYMSAFSQRPFGTWKTLEEKMQPYLRSLKIGEREKYMVMLDKVSNLFEIEDFACDKPLNGLYLLGFHSQSCELRNYVEKREEGKNE